jgi:hypothetical protein
MRKLNVSDKSPGWPSGSINEIAKTTVTPNTVGRWNTYEITAHGDHLVAVLNGQTTVDTRVPAEGVRQAAGARTDSAAVRWRERNREVPERENSGEVNQ